MDMSTRNRLTRSNNIAPELTELGTGVGPRRYEEGRRVRYKSAGVKAQANAPVSVGVIRAILRDPRQPTEESPRYEIENEISHTKTAVYERNIVGAAVE